MTVTLELPPELEARLQEEAQRRGLQLGEIVREVLNRGLPKADVGGDRVSPRESELLQRVDLGLSDEFWNRYRVLSILLEEETLTDEQHAELMAMVEKVETANVRRLEAVVELAKLRGLSLDAMMDELKLRPQDPYE